MNLPLENQLRYQSDTPARKQSNKHDNTTGVRYHIPSLANTSINPHSPPNHTKIICTSHIFHAIIKISMCKNTTQTMYFWRFRSTKTRKGVHQNEWTTQKDDPRHQNTQFKSCHAFRLLHFIHTSDLRYHSVHAQIHLYG